MSINEWIAMEKKEKTRKLIENNDWEKMWMSLEMY